jgi:predicted DNA-binding ribbon-helix-helix protein
MKSAAIKKRSILVVGHKTSISLEDEFWESLREIAGKRHLHVGQLIAEIDEGRHLVNLSSAIRLFILRYYRDRAGQEGGMAPVPTQEPLNAVKHIGSSG